MQKCKHCNATENLFCWLGEYVRTDLKGCLDRMITNLLSKPLEVKR